MAKWQRTGDAIDGAVLWASDEEQLRTLGCSATVAQRIVRAVAAVKAAAAATQVGGCS